MNMSASAAAPAAGSTRRGLVPASVVLLGALLSLIGFEWDVQWHIDVGPDTFFTLPHLFIYSGSAVSGLASLWVVLTTTAAERAGRPVDPIVGGRAVGVFGRTFAAPAGYLISGAGAAVFLLYGLWDQWWHSLYGFDVTIVSPPHIGLLLSITVTMVGMMMIFATARQHRWGAVGTVVSAAVLVAFSMATVIGLDVLDTEEAVDAGVVFVCALLLMTAARALNRPGGAIGVAAVVVATQAVMWWFAPWAAETYAGAIGLPMRDYLEGVPRLPAMIPMTLIVAGGLVEIARRWPGWLTGAACGVVLGLCVPLQRAWLYDTGMESSGVLIGAAAGLVFGALAGFLGARFGEMLRQLAPKEAVSNA